MSLSDDVSVKLFYRIPMKLISLFLREQSFSPDEGDYFEGTQNLNQEMLAVEKYINTDFYIGNNAVVNFEGNLFPEKVI